MQGELFGIPDAAVTTSLDGTAKGRAKAKREFRQSTPEENRALMERVIAEGRHKPHWQTVCSECRQWVDSIVYVSPQDRLKRFCINCCPVDIREELQAAQRKRETGDAELAAVFDTEDAAPSGDVELPPGVSRAEEIGLPEQPC